MTEQSSHKKEHQSLWSGRFSKSQSQELIDFNESISVDKVLWRYDILGTMAHVKMLQQCNILTKDELTDVLKALNELEAELADADANGTLDAKFSINHEDIHTNIEVLLTEKIGTLAKKIHTGRSRNDQVATDLRLYCVDAIMQVKSHLADLCALFLNLAEKNKNHLMPSYTHLQKAQPASLGHYFCSYAEQFIEDISRLDDSLKRVSRSPLGAGSIAGSCLKLDRTSTAKTLGFNGLMDGIMHNSQNAVCNRDFVIETISNISLAMIHLSRLSEDVVLFSSDEFGYFVIDDAFATGSSLMPNKKNPDITELIRGKSGVAIGNLMAILAIVKNLPNGYNKDMQEDKGCLFSSVNTILSCCKITTAMFKCMTYNTEAMKKSVQNSYALSTDVLDYLIIKGVYFRDAHEIVGKIVKYAISQRKFLHELTLQEFQSQSAHFQEDIFEMLNIDNIINNHQTHGSPNPDCVQKTIDIFHKQLKIFNK